MIENRRFTSLIFHLFTARRLLTRPSHIRLSNAVMSVVSLVANSFFGLVFFSFLYGFLGYVLSILQFIRLGPRRFFHRVARPTPPVRALDPIYGDHSMIKLKVSEPIDQRSNLFSAVVVRRFDSLRFERLAESADDPVSARFSRMLVFVAIPDETLLSGVSRRSD